MRIDSAAEFTDYWRGVRKRTTRVVEQIREEDLEWTAAPSRWTIGDIVRHLAGIERDMYAENVSGRPARYPGHGRELADGLAAVRAYHGRQHEESLAIFSQLTPEQLAGKCQTPAGTPITTWKWLRAMVEHEAHHRGQLYLLLGLRGVKVPQIFGLTEEEVKARSGR
ncbi:MAG: DinB family protein [Gemmatimonadaceae bacterium]